jgi:metallo-beta-lactamase family protein
MKLTFYGAAGKVTGSCYLLETSRARVLVDFGLHQGDPEEEQLNRKPPPLNAPALDAVVLTHAHLDHSGLLPLLKNGNYNGAIYCTPATLDLVPLLLEDSARIQESDSEDSNLERTRQGLPPIQPLYTDQDVTWTLSRMLGVPYYEWKEIAPGVSMRLVDSGHIIGAASVEMVAEENGRSKRIVFSGDIGPRGAPLVRDPTELKQADVLILESTYGDRDHKTREASLEEFRAVIEEATAGDGKVLIPAFAVGRTQDMIFEIGRMVRSGRIRSEVFVDSPMAIETTEIYRRHRHLFDGEAQSMLGRGETPLKFDGLQYVRKSQDSKALNHRGGGIVIIAGSGMCTGGRILFHLKHGLSDPKNHLVFVGYQAHGTLGRRLVDREAFVEVMGQRIEVKVKLHTIGGFSAHAGRSGLLSWASHFSPRPQRIFLTHGEDPPRRALAAGLEQSTGIRCDLPYYGDTVEL